MCNLFSEHDARNAQGTYKGKWQISMKSFRSTLGSVPGFQVPVERSICTLTVDGTSRLNVHRPSHFSLTPLISAAPHATHLPDNVFCVLEDPAAPMRGDYLAQAAEYARTQPGAPLPPPTHFRHTFPTLGPPGALEQLLTQLRARWVPVRQTGGANAAPGNAGQKGQPGLATGAHLTVDGHVYAIGSDWLVRAGNVIISPGGAMKGMLLEVRTHGVVAGRRADTKYADDGMLVCGRRSMSRCR